MRIAFLIPAYTDPNHLKRLIEALPDDSMIYVHIDLKSNIKSFTDMITDKRVHFIKHRCKVAWGAITQVEYQMELIRAALTDNGSFDYLAIVSGQDYPLWSKYAITSYFEDMNGREIICGNDLSWQKEAARMYREYRFFSDKLYKKGSIGSIFRVALRRSLSVVGIKKPLIFKAGGKNYKLYKGSDWWAITRDMACFVLNEWDTNKELVNYFKSSAIPSETFVQTIVFNSTEYKDRCILIEGPYPGLDKLTPLTYIYYHPLIKILDENDYDILRKSGKMFARKFVTGKSDKLISMIEADKNEHCI